MTRGAALASDRQAGWEGRLGSVRRKVPRGAQAAQAGDRTIRSDSGPAKKLRNAYRAKIRKAERKGDEQTLANLEGVIERIFDEVLVRSLKRLVPAEKKVRQQQASQ